MDPLLPKAAASRGFPIWIAGCLHSSSIVAVELSTDGSSASWPGVLRQAARQAAVSVVLMVLSPNVTKPRASAGLDFSFRVHQPISVSVKMNPPVPGGSLFVGSS